MTHIIPIIMCGGAGERLWPASRRDYPKPFMVVGGKPLLQHALERAAAMEARDVVIITNEAYHHLAQTIADALGVAFKLHYLLEPQGRNTAPAIALAVQYIADKFGAQSTCLVMTADHLITPLQAFSEDAALAATQAKEGALVVFGVPPTHPYTGYGYIGVAEQADAPQSVVRFTEKPDRATAQDYLQAGRYYWNSGMFCFLAEVMIDNLKTHAPEIWAASARVFAGNMQDGQCVRFAEADFAAQPDISIDYAVIEHAAHVVMVAARFAWSDVGSWASVADTHSKDADGNSAVGIDASHLVRRATRNTHIEAHPHTEKIIATIGLDNLVIVDTPDALLIAERTQTDEVRALVGDLKAGDDVARASVQASATVYRPWGSYTTLAQEAGYQVKRIAVNRGAQLSLQYHHHRAEHWVVVQGTARVQIGDAQFEVHAGDYRYIPLGEKHRLTNIGTQTLILVEVQCGDYLGEDDIVRLADDYGRIKP